MPGGIYSVLSRTIYSSSISMASVEETAAPPPASFDFLLFFPASHDIKIAIITRLPITSVFCNYHTNFYKPNRPQTKEWLSHQ